ncbi:MAG: hypothetical protein ACJA1C_002209 [Crocinitomicaceae bacterium]|jgi:hypothetical protein
MILEKQLEKKVKDYLVKKGGNFIESSISYNFLRENAKQLDGTTKPMHVVSFQVLIFKDSEERQNFSIWIDVESENLEFLLTPNKVEFINE